MIAKGKLPERIAYRSALKDIYINGSGRIWWCIMEGVLPLSSPKHRYVVIDAHFNLKHTKLEPSSVDDLMVVPKCFS
jgi:hypothetical protein